MGRLVIGLLLVTIAAIASMVVSCAKEEEPVQEMTKVTPEKVAVPPRQPEKVGVNEVEAPPGAESVPPKEAGPPPQGEKAEAEKPGISDLALRPSQRQTRDIMSGNPVKSNIFADYAGKRIYFCCDESKRRFQMEPDVWMKRAEELGMVLQDTP